MVFQAGNEEFVVCWPFKNMEVERGAVVVFLWGAAPPSERREGAGLGAVDRFAVHGHPLADVLQTLDARFGDETFLGGADIEEVVAAFAGDVDELLDEGF